MAEDFSLGKEPKRFERMRETQHSYKGIELIPICFKRQGKKGYILGFEFTVNGSDFIACDQSRNFSIHKSLQACQDRIDAEPKRYGGQFA